MAHQPTKPPFYIGIYVTLLCLTALTVLIANNQDYLRLHRNVYGIFASSALPIFPHTVTSRSFKN